MEGGGLHAPHAHTPTHTPLTGCARAVPIHMSLGRWGQERGTLCLCVSPLIFFFSENFLSTPTTSYGALQEHELSFWWWREGVLPYPENARTQREKGAAVHAGALKDKETGQERTEEEGHALTGGRHVYVFPSFLAWPRHDPATMACMPGLAGRHAILCLWSSSLCMPLTAWHGYHATA